MINPQTYRFNYLESPCKHQRGSKVYEGTNHLGNVLVTFSDKRLTECHEDTIYRYVADVKSQTDYSAFGVLWEERHWYANQDSGGYRFGFNGQEKDNEVSGLGNSNTAEFWQYDTRLGRRWNVDPKPNPSISSYTCFANSPLIYSDVKGDTVKFAGFVERVQISFRRILSKEFNEKFKVLDKSSNTYKYSNSEIRNGIIEGASGYVENTGKGQFTIHYTTNGINTFNAHKNFVGANKWHTLFEETYHAWDYEQGSAGSGLELVAEGNKVLIGSENLETRKTAEARAWIWTVQNTNIRGNASFELNGWTYYTERSLVKLILENPNEEVVKGYLYDHYFINATKRRFIGYNESNQKIYEVDPLIEFHEYGPYKPRKE